MKEKISFIKIKTAVFIVVILLWDICALHAQDGAKKLSGDFYRNKMFRLQNAIEKYFYESSAGFYKETFPVEKGKNAYSYLWPLCGMIQATNEIEKVTHDKGPFQKIVNIISFYYNPAAPAPGYDSYIRKLGGGDRFYDDNQWIGIAMMDAYNREKQSSFIDTGKEMYRYMMTGFDTVCGGGLYWQENKKTSKNTCSNGPGIILALQLYKATGDKAYLDTALLIFDWVNKTLKDPSALYLDNIDVKSRKTDLRKYSYNTGTMLQSNVYLYEITHNKKYLDEAISIADSSVAFFYKNGVFKDNYWFNAVLLRGYQHLLQYHNDLKYIQAFKACVDNALRHDLNETGLFGKNKIHELVGQSGMLEILARFAYLESRYQL